MFYVVGVSYELLSSVSAEKQKYTARKCIEETAERCRLSWVHTPNLLACSDES